MTGSLAEYIADLPLIDNHVHGYWQSTVDRSGFEAGISEANIESLADFDSGFDTAVGFAIRAHCAPVLGLPRHASADGYWERRSGFGPGELARMFLTRAGVTDWLVDTGVADDVAGPLDMAALTDSRGHEIVRLEQLAEQAAARPGDYAGNFRDLLSRRAASAVATKTVLAYRGGFAGDLSAPSERDVAIAAERWRDNGGRRLTDRVLLRFGLHEALRLGKPLQVHVGFGDRECDLHRSNPTLLLDFLRASGDTPIVLLHCYPYEREAGYLAAAFNNVYLDVGLSINYLGARAGGFLARTLELSPFRKILYSSDAYGPPELHYLGARLWRIGMASVLGDFVDRDEWSVADARRVARLIGRGNAARLYRLG